MIINNFLDRVNANHDHDIATKSIFGDLGVFCHDAMFALIAEQKLYLRGSPELDPIFTQLNCNKYLLVKKQSTSVVNYYDVTALFISHHPKIDHFIETAKVNAVQEKINKQQLENRRMRDLPNMHLSIERMLKKSGIKSVKEFNELGAVSAYLKLKQRDGGSDPDVRILWKMYGALKGMHWELIQEPMKEELLNQVRERESPYFEKD